MRIGILGPLEVRDGAGRPVEVAGRRLRLLLIRLALDPGRPVPAETLIDDLWPDSPPARAANALQSLVSRLRAALGATVVCSGPGGYHLEAAPGDVDATEFDRLVTAGDPAALRRALALWRGPALADAAEYAFAAPVIARLEELRLAATEELIEAELADGRAAELVPRLEELRARNPLRERLHGQLMRALAASGRSAAALDVYETLRATLADRLGADPGAELAALHLDILREPQAPAMIEKRPGRAGNLPAQITSFVGRETELARLAGLLGEVRLITLTGPGGTGKTRLAIEAAAALEHPPVDGVWFVPLASVRDPQDVAQTILSALGAIDRILPVEGLDPGGPAARLIDVLADQRLVLVLDNCEHVIEAVATLADRVLAAAPGVRIMATSREPLGITGETLCPVPALGLPPEDAEPAVAETYPAIRLFAERAAAVRPGFVVDDGNVAQVLAVCRALDGAPLAIELAAARLRALTNDQVAGRLADRFRLLSTGSRAALPRHQTLRAIVDWSWELLDDRERRVLRRLSVFHGGATPDAAEEVTQDSVDVLAALVDKSLVVAEGNGEVRYRLLETVRAYAAEKLAVEEGEEKAARDAHAAWYTAYAELGDPELRGAAQTEWAKRLLAERDNFNAALRHTVDSGDVRTSVRLVAALIWFWVTHDLETEGSRWGTEVRTMAGEVAPEGLEEQYALCSLLWSAGLVLNDAIGPTGGDIAAQLTELGNALKSVVDRLPSNSKHPALAIAGPLSSLFTGGSDVDDRLAELAHHPDPWVRAARHTFAGVLRLNGGRPAQAKAELEAARIAFLEVGERVGLTFTLAVLGEITLAAGDYAEAVEIFNDAYESSWDGLSRDSTLTLLINRGRAKGWAGDLEGAREDIETGIAAAGRIGEFVDQAGGYQELGELARRAGDLDTARERYEAALQLIESRSWRPDGGLVHTILLSRLGCVAEVEGDLEQARRFHREAMRVAAGVPFMMNTAALATALAGVAALEQAGGDSARAAELLGTACTIMGTTDAANHEAARTTAAARAVLGADEFQAAYDRGRKVTREQAKLIEV